MYILSPVETWRTTWAHTICSQGLDGFLFEGFVRNEVVEVIRREIRHRPPIGQLRLGASRAKARSVIMSPSGFVDLWVHTQK